MELDFHPWTDLFPLANGWQIGELAGDIQEHGLREPIAVYEGQIIDGRSRYLACQQLGIEPLITHPRGQQNDVLMRMVQKNLHEHQPALTKVQRGALAVELLELIEGPPPYPRSIEHAMGHQVDVGVSSVTRILGIRNRSPHLFNQLKAGELSIAEASRQAGFIEYGGSRGKDVPLGVKFGKGDKFWEAAAAIDRYLSALGNKGFQFSHIAPKEAARRLKKVDKILDLLLQAREELVVRSDRSFLSVTYKPKEKKTDG